MNVLDYSGVDLSLPKVIFHPQTKIISGASHDLEQEGGFKSVKQQYDVRKASFTTN